MQYANGVSPGPLILSYLLFDAIFITVISIALAPIISGPIQAWVGSGALLGVALVLYGLAAVLVGHVVSHFTAGPLKAFIAAFGVNLVMFAVSAGAYGVSAQLGSDIKRGALLIQIIGFDNVIRKDSEGCCIWLRANLADRKHF